ncbi:MAG: selenocysteine-specific translation elongation factor [Alphaproteobacteria bacterium]|nr:selenocysteine-specific translation elongation factor [Alphaproteobacteria bacterium]MCB9793031.1 selenocysteine-specific translation elongation factor [Alphaproteobacteria bacterium]
MSKAPDRLPDAFVIGTAGHIDHGKTSLVRALTGVDLDRLPEEKRRGITIALGFTTLALPSGRVASFVDVPGHERLVRTMIAGACGLDAVLLCVSAVEGVMPQTREHLDILGLLGVHTGLVVLTMGDLVDEDLAELAVEDARDAVVGTFLEGAPILMTSAHAGAGLAELTEAIDRLPLKPRPEGGPFRLPVDRSFVRRGFGSVVTGTVLSGEVQDGDELVLLPDGERTRVRGLQVHGEPHGHSVVGYRTALNLAGVEREQLPRGTVVASPQGVPVTSMMDGSYRQLRGAPPLSSGDRVRLLLGTAEVMAVAYPVGEDIEPGAEGFLQLRTAEPVVAMPGDRFVLRRESPVTTLGGGEVLDPWAPKLRRRDHALAESQLRRLAEGERVVYLERAGASGLSRAEFQERVGARPEDAQVLGDQVLSEAALEALSAALLEELAQAHAANPLAPGINRRALHRGSLLALQAPAFDALLRQAAEAGSLRIEGARCAAPGWSVQLSPTHEADLDRLRTRLRAAGLAAISTGELLEEVAEGEALLNLLVDGGEAEKIGGRFHHVPALDALVAEVKAALQAEGELTPGRFKELTGLTRKNAIPLLEWLDSKRITRRDGDRRVAR